MGWKKRMEGDEPTETRPCKKARIAVNGDDALQRDQRTRLGWRSVLARCRQGRRRRTQEAAPSSAWDALPDEAAWCILVLCSQREICALAATCRRMHRLCTDDALWRHVYLRDFPPCRHACLLVLGDAVLRSPLSPLDYARRRLDRLLDPDDDLSTPLDPVGVAAGWDVERLTVGVADAVARCVHHWPTVIAARGYRWACASMVPLTSYRMPQRRFYPINAPDGCGTVVGRCVVTSGSIYDHDDDKEEPYGSHYTASYRGQVEIQRHGFVPHGLGTISGHGATALPWTCRSGAWRHGQIVSEGPCAMWQWAAGRPDAAVFVHCRAGDRVRHTEAVGKPECGVGVLLSSDGDVAIGCLCHPRGDPREGTTRVALVARGERPDRRAGTVTVMTTGASLRCVATHLCSTMPRGIDGVGLLRAPLRKVVFAGSFADGEPHVGKTWDSDGRLLYDGSFKWGAPFKHGALDCGVLYATDGTTLDGVWVCGWRDATTAARHIPATRLTASHPDGATVVWKDWMRIDGRVRPRVANFWWTPSTAGADFHAIERPWPSADWDVFLLPPDPAPPLKAPVRPLLAEAGLAIAQSMHFLHADEIVGDLAFWPRPNPREGPRPHLEDTLAFVSRMAATRPRWARCCRVVSAMYGPA